MKDKKNMLTPQLEEELHDIGIDLTILKSLANVMECSINDEYNISHVDVANLTIVMKRLIKLVKAKYDKVESFLNI